MNLLLMNETAIYSHYSGRHSEADEIFAQMKKLYPDHPVTLHNEALYFEKKAREEIQQRWQKYQDAAGFEDNWAHLKNPDIEDPSLHPDEMEPESDSESSTASSESRLPDADNHAENYIERADTESKSSETQVAEEHAIER